MRKTFVGFLVIALLTFAPVFADAATKSTKTKTKTATKTTAPKNVTPPDGVEVVHPSPDKRIGPDNVYPDASVNPGATNPDITQANIGKTICSVTWHGVNLWSGVNINGTGSIRPPSSYTTRLKIKQMKDTYGDTVHQASIGGNTDHCKPHSDNTGCYEEDHIVSLENGGAPADPKNLYPEPYNTDVKGDVVGAHEKDKVENFVHNGICLNVKNAKFSTMAPKPKKALTLEQGQRILAIDWYACYVSMVASKDCKPPAK